MKHKKKGTQNIIFLFKNEQNQLIGNVTEISRRQFSNEEDQIITSLYNDEGDRFKSPIKK
jgi:hypothetical protein